MNNGGHYYNICEYGTIHGQCRCASTSKSAHRIECPDPEECAVKTGTSPGEPYMPKHRREVKTSHGMR